MSRFKYDGLPEYFDHIFFERTLFEENKAVIYKRNDSQYIAGSLAGITEYNIYGYPVKGMGITYVTSYDLSIYDGYNDGIDNINSVVCYSTYNKNNNLFSLIKNYLYKMVELMVNTDITILQSRKPYIFVIDESERANAELLLNDLDSGRPVIIANKSFDGIQTQLLELPNKIATLKDYEMSLLVYDNIIRKLLGIENNEASDKKERLITDEMNANNISTNINLFNQLEARRDFIAKVNKIFNLNITIDLVDLSEINLGGATNIQDVNEDDSFGGGENEAKADE